MKNQLAATSGPSRIAACLFLAALVIRIPFLFNGLWFDELFVTRVFLKDIYHLFYLILKPDHLPLYYTGMFAWTRVFGDSAISVRMVSLIFGLLTLPLAYRAASRIGGKEAGVWAVFFLAVSPVHVWYSAEAGEFVLLMFLSLAIAVSFWEWREAGGRGRWGAAYALSAGAAVFIHPYMVVFPFAAAVLCVRPFAGRWFILAVSAGVLALLAGYIWLRSLAVPFPQGMEYLRPFTPYEAWMLFFNYFFLGDAVQNLHKSYHVLSPSMPAVALHVLGVAAFAAGLGAIFREKDPQRRAAGAEAFVFFLATPVLLFALHAFGRDRTYVERAALASLPFFWILLSAGLAARWRIRRARLAAGLAMVGLQVCVLGLFFMKYRLEEAVGPPKNDWKPVARYVASRLQERTLVVCGGRATELMYYEPRLLESTYRDVIYPCVGRARELLVPVQRVLGEDHPLVVNLRQAFHRVLAPVPGRVPVFPQPTPAKDLKERGVRRVLIIRWNSWVGTSDLFREQLLANPAYRLSERRVTGDFIIFCFDLAPKNYTAHPAKN